MSRPRPRRPSCTRFACATIPCTYPVKLRVTDDSDPARSATAIVNIDITNPPHPPVANAGGPYLTSLCANDSLAAGRFAIVRPG